MPGVGSMGWADLTGGELRLRDRAMLVGAQGVPTMLELADPESAPIGTSECGLSTRSDPAKRGRPDQSDDRKQAGQLACVASVPESTRG